jgi:tripartite-type tricarboxylate transporter receptor subunit TctC
MKDTFTSLFGRAAGVVALALIGVAQPAAADEISFAGKTVNMTIGFAAGGGVDLYGRLLGLHMMRYLPGNPNLVVLNQLGAGGVVALNSWAAKSQPDGLSITIGAQSQSDPEAIFSTDAKYDPTKFKYVGGVAAPSQGLFINKDALARLHDKSQKPVVMGMVGTTLRSGYYQALWGAAFLGWNLRWVPGYQGTGEIRQAMDRGEVDMSAFGAVNDIKYLQSTDKYTVVSQSGSVQNGKRTPLAMLGDAPIIGNLVQGKIKDPAAQAAFDYSENVVQVGKWLALPPGTPDAIVAAYIAAFEATLKDPKFQEDVKNVDPDSPIARKADLEMIVHELAKVSRENLEFIKNELKRQGT